MKRGSRGRVCGGTFGLLHYLRQAWVWVYNTKISCSINRVYGCRFVLLQYVLAVAVEDIFVEASPHIGDGVLGDGV